MTLQLFRELTQRLGAVVHSAVFERPKNLHLPLYRHVLRQGLEVDWSATIEEY